MQRYKLKLLKNEEILLSEPNMHRQPHPVSKRTWHPPTLRNLQCQATGKSGGRCQFCKYKRLTFRESVVTVLV